MDATQRTDTKYMFEGSKNTNNISEVQDEIYPLDPKGIFQNTFDFDKNQETIDMKSESGELFFQAWSPK